MIEQIYMTPRLDPNSSQSGSGSNDNEGLLNITQSSRTGASLSDEVLCHIQDTCLGAVLPFSRGAVGVFYWPSW